MSKKFYGIYKSSTAIRVEEIDESIDYKKFSNTVEIEFGEGRNGNGVFYMKIFTQGEFKEIVSGKWRINPFINCSYNWTDEWAKIDVTDVNDREIQCNATIDWRSIYKRNGDNTVGITSIFRFISSLKDYLNAEHYLLCKEIESTLGKWKYYDADGVILKSGEYVEATKTILEINKTFEQLQASINNPNELIVLNNLKDTLLKNLEEKYNRFINKQQ